MSGKNKIRCPKGSYYVIDWGGLSDIEKIYDFLYKDATVYLRRKKETFDAVVNITKNKKNIENNGLHILFWRQEFVSVSRIYQ